MTISAIAHKALHPILTAGTISVAVLISAAPAKAVEISNVSPDVFTCMKEHNSNERGYLSFPNGNSGTINAYADVLDMWGGSVDFTYNPSEQVLTVTNPQGPGGEEIEAGLRDIAKKCINGEFEQPEETA